MIETIAKVLETMRSAGKPVSAGGHPFRTRPQGGGQGFRPAQEGRHHRITRPLQVAACRVTSDYLKILPLHWMCFGKT